MNGDKLTGVDNRVLRRILGAKRGEVTGGWGKLSNGRLHNLYSSPSTNRIIEDEMGRECSKNRGEEECMYDIGGKARKKETIRKIKT
jgi:hypothetical protein